MKIKSFSPKWSDEEYYVTFSFFRVIGNVAFIAEAVVTVTDAEGIDKTSDITTEENQIISRTRVNIWIKGGTAQQYKITCKITTSSDEKYILFAYLTVVVED